MVTETDCAAHAKQGSEEEAEQRVTLKKGDWESVATRLLALCGGLEQYDDVECVGWCAQEKRKNRADSRSNSLPRTPELVQRRSASSSFSYTIKARSLSRDRSQSSDLLSIPTLQTRTRSCEEMTIAISDEKTASREMSSKNQIRTTTL